MRSHTTFTKKRIENAVSYKEDPYANFWGDKANYYLGLAYFCKKDPRLVVPKRRKWMGLTVNFARPMAVPLVVFSVGLILVPLEVLQRLGVLNKPVFYGTLFGSMFFVLGFWACLAKAGRATHN